MSILSKTSSSNVAHITVSPVVLSPPRLIPSTTERVCHGCYGSISDFTQIMYCNSCQLIPDPPFRGVWSDDDNLDLEKHKDVLPPIRFSRFTTDPTVCQGCCKFISVTSKYGHCERCKLIPKRVAR